MAKSLYEVLGVPVNATLAEIRKAWKKFAQKHHPDKKEGNQIAVYDEVRHAYEILRDPQRREQYDLTGETAKPPGKDQLVLALLAGFFSQWMDTPTNQRGKDVVPDVHGAIQTAIANLTKNIVACNDHVEALEKHKSRITAKGAHDLFTGAANDKIANINKQIEELKKQIDIHEAADNMLEDYEYEVEKEQEYTITMPEASSYFSGFP